MSTKDHYDKHLGNIYVWMCGAFEENRITQQNFFDKHNIRPTINSVALDLGAGHGIHAIALANLSFQVTAVDFHTPLLEALQRNDVKQSVTVVEDELLSFVSRTNLQPELVICMGDTISHLESTEQVEALFEIVFQKLQPGGKLILSFRDLVSELTGVQRFIPVRSDSDRILTCFLEYFPDKVVVHDILHQREGDRWKQTVSAYAKLRLNEIIVSTLLSKYQFTIIKTETINRMIHIIAAKP